MKFNLVQRPYGFANRLFHSRGLQYNIIMSTDTWFRRVLPILAIVGLILGPITAPVNGAAMAAAAPMSEMMDGMPCSPSEPPSVQDCQMTCALMAVCMAKCFPNALTLSVLNSLLPIGRDVLAPGRDMFHGSLAAKPPARPPRI